MGTVIFSGTVSKQAVAGESVTITILLADGAPITSILTITDGTGAFAANWTGSAGSYKAYATIDEDNEYLAAESAEVLFVIEPPPKQPRTITLNIDSVLP